MTLPTDDERDAVDDGQAALDALIGRLADVPTPGGDPAAARRRQAPRDLINCDSTECARSRTCTPDGSSATASMTG